MDDDRILMSQQERNPYRILIVDDERGQAELIKEFLEISGDFCVEWAGSVALLWEHLAANSYHTILLDYRLPDGTGLEILEEFQRRGIKTPAVLITGQGDERLAVRAMQQGAVDYLIKGSDFLPTLPALIQKAIRSAELQDSVDRSNEQIRYQALLLNNVRDAIVVWDKDGIIRHWNYAAAILFGYSVKDRVGKPVSDFYLSEFDPPVNVPPGEGTGGQEVSRRFVHKDGRTIWVSSRVNALRDYGANSKLIGYMDVSRDITSRKQTEDALRAERNFVSGVLNTVGALVVVLDANGLVVRFNRAFEQITGYNLEEMRGRSFVNSFIVPEEVPQVLQSFNELSSCKQHNQQDNYLIAKDGSRHLISWSNTVILDRKGGTDYVIATGIDITERNRAEQALRASEERYRTVSELVSDFVYSFSIDSGGKYHIEWTTNSFNRLVGLDPRRLDLRRDWAKFIHPEDGPTVQKMIAELKSGQPHVCELRIISSDGQEVWIQNYARPVIDHERGGAIRIYGAGKNITENKSMENQIRAAQVRLTNSARLAAIGELASGVAHHINNPLTTIIAESQILLQNIPEDHAARESAEAIELSGWRVQKAVQQLLEFSRPAGNTLEPVSVNHTVKSALSLIGDQIISSGVTLRIELTENLPVVQGNERQLGDLWVNLLLLARDATSGESQHTIRVRSWQVSEVEIEVEISDDGEPIPPDEMQILFEPNFITPIGGRGTGIELNICQEIVRQHRGEITAASSPDDGTSFRVRFPVEV